MKRALVLAGGGTRGIYQCGALEALRDLGEYRFDIVTGTSVGALTAMMLTQNDFDSMVDMYEHLEPDQIINGFVPNDMSLGTLIKERDSFIPSFHYWVKEHGVDIRPLEEMIDKYYDPERFFASPIDFGCIAATAKGHEPVYVTKEMMREHGEDWLAASAAAYPAFPVREIEGKEYVDGGYFDNFPVDYALRLGADEIVAIDLSNVPTHPLYLNRPQIRYIHPHTELFRFLDFNKEKFAVARRWGYLDMMKSYGRYEGEKYAYEPFEIKEKWFDDWMRELMMLETRIKLASSINNRFVSETLVTDRLKEMLHTDHLSQKQYLFGMMDMLMDLLGCDDTQVYTFKDAKNRILKEFAETAYEDYPYLPSLAASQIVAYTKTLDQLGIIRKLVHANLYPDHRFLSESMILTMYPFEQAAADFITFMMKGLLEEDTCRKSQSSKKSALSSFIRTGTELLDRIRKR